MAPLEADELFACLDRHGVQYVLIGGLAAVLHGSPLPTLDADICPSRAQENLVRLAAALGELDARIRTPDAAEGVRFPHEAAFLARVELLHSKEAANRPKDRRSLPVLRQLLDEVRKRRSDSST